MICITCQTNDYKYIHQGTEQHKQVQYLFFFQLFSFWYLHPAYVARLAGSKQNKKKVATVAKNVCQATELGLQYQPFDIHCSWELVSVLNQTTDGSRENRDFEMDGTPQPLEKNETFTTVRRSHPLVTVKKPELLRLEYLENFQLSSIKDNE